MIKAKLISTDDGSCMEITYPKYLGKQLAHIKELHILVLVDHFTDASLPHMEYQTSICMIHDLYDFFEKYLPKYEVNYYPENRPEALEPSQCTVRTKKEAIKLDPCLEKNTTFDWDSMNYSDESMVLQILAEAMWEEINKTK